MKKSTSGFTIIELLVVIVVIGILASITAVTFRGVQQRARDAQRRSDLTIIAKALEYYKIDNGSYPGSPGWCTQISNPAHPDVANAISTYTGTLPKDPSYRNTYRDYFFYNNGASPYGLYAQMETTSMANGSYPTGGCTTIGSTPHTYNYNQQ